MAKLILAEMEGPKSILNFTGNFLYLGEVVKICAQHIPMLGGTLLAQLGIHWPSRSCIVGIPIGMAGRPVAIARLFLLGNGNLHSVVLGGCLAS